MQSCFTSECLAKATLKVIYVSYALPSLYKPEMGSVPLSELPFLPERPFFV